MHCIKFIENFVILCHFFFLGDELDVSQLRIFAIIHFKWEIHAKPDSLLRYNKAVYSKVAFEIQYINENTIELIKYKCKGKVYCR